jgi:hypothetical protein
MPFSSAPQQRCHLAILDEQGDRVLGQQIADAWVLPYSYSEPRRRLSTVIQTALRDLGLNGRQVGVIGGRVDYDKAVLDYFAVVQLSGHRAPPRSYQWFPVTHLPFDRAFISYQGEQLAQYLKLCSSVPPSHPLAPMWREQVTEWIRNAVDRQDRRLNDWSSTLRAGIGRQVVQFGTTAGPVYLRAGAFVRDEAIATIALHEVLPELVPLTLAFDEERGWWLTEHVRGRRLSRESARSTLPRLVDLLLEVPRRLDRERVSLLQKRGIPELNWWTAPMRARELMDAALCNGAIGRDDREFALHALETLAGRVQQMAIPSTWIHVDVAPDNLVVHGDRLTFVDLDPPHLGPPYVTLELAIRECARQQPPASVSEVRDRYVSKLLGLRTGQAMRECQGIASAMTEVVFAAATTMRIDRSVQCGETLQPDPHLKGRLGARLSRVLAEWSGADASNGWSRSRPSIVGELAGPDGGM